MIGADRQPVIGQGGPTLALAPGDLRAIVAQALAGVSRGTRVLAIVPDRTRDDNTHLLFPFAAEVLEHAGAARLDALVAQGTHPSMSDADKRAKIGSGDQGVPCLGRIFDHQWHRDADLVTLGSLGADRIRTLTGGLMADPVPVRLNARLAAGVYDLVLVFGATMPHEV